MKEEITAKWQGEKSVKLIGRHTGRIIDVMPPVSLPEIPGYDFFVLGKKALGFDAAKLSWLVCDANELGTVDVFATCGPDNVWKSL